MRAIAACDKGPELLAMLANEVCQQKTVDEQQVLDIIEDRFESAKRRFNPSDESQPKTMSVNIGVDGVLIGNLVLDRLVPRVIFLKGLCHLSVYIPIPFADFSSSERHLIQKSFDKPTDEVLVMAQNQVRKFNAKYKGKRQLNVSERSFACT